MANINKILISVILIVLCSLITYSEYPDSNPFNATHIFHLNEGVGDGTINNVDNQYSKVFGYPKAWNSSGKFGYGISNTTLINISDYTLGLNREKFSASFWTYKRNVAYSEQAMFTFGSSLIVGYENNDCTQGFLVFLRTGDTDNSCTGSSFICIPALSPETWYNVIITQDRANAKQRVFINGVNVVNGTVSGRLCFVGTGATYSNTITFGGTYDIGKVYQQYKGIVDDVLFFNGTILTDPQINTIATDGFITYTIPSFENPTPISGDTDNIQKIINVSCANSNVTLFFDNETNPKTEINGNNHGSLFNWTTNLTLNGAYYYKASCDNGSYYNTSVRIFNYDTETPTIRTTLINNTVLYLNNFTGQINASDNILLHGFNISVDGITYFNIEHIHTGNYSYNLTYKPKENNITYGAHIMNIKVSDGHTAKELISPEDIEVSTPLLFENELRYKIEKNPYIENTFKISTKEKDLSDKWEYEFKKDKIIEKLTPKNPKTKMSFTFESQQKIFIAEKAGKYGGKWLITGDKWKDFVIKGDTQAYIESITLLSDYKAEIVINNIQNSNYIEFESTGDLNILNRQYYFNYSNLTVSNIFILPSNAFSNEDLIGYCNATEAENRSIVIGYQWYKNKIFLESGLYGNNYYLNQSVLSSAVISGVATNTFINYTNPFLRDFKASATFQGVDYNYTNPLCIHNPISIKRVSSGLGKELFCYDYTADDYISLKSALGVETLTYNGLYLDITNPEKLSNQITIVKTLGKGNNSENDNYTFSCAALSNNIFTDYSNSSIANILSLDIGICNARLKYTIFNLSTKDEISKELISTNKGYNLQTYNLVNYKNISTINNSEEYNLFCSNINSSNRVLNWTIWGNILISKEGYATRLIEIDSEFPLRVYNNNQKNFTFYLISLSNSTTVTYNWFTTAYQRISGIQNIYRCNGDNTQTLIESTPIIDGSSVANIEVLNVPYSYTVIYNGILYTDLNSYSKCHIEATPTTAINYYIDVTQEDFNGYLDLSQVNCNLTKSSSSQGSLSWGALSGVIGNINIYRNGEYLTTVSSELSPLLYNLPETSNNYNLVGYLQNNGNIKTCGEAVFNQNKSNSNLFGLIGIFSCFILLSGLVLIYAGEKEKTLIILAVGLIAIFIIGLTSLSWPNILYMISLIILVMLVGRYARR